MGGKYRVEGSKYPYKGYTDYSYGSNSLIVAVFMAIRAYLKYPIVDIYVRDHKRMNGKA